MNSAKEHKAAKVAAQKALGVCEGEWIIYARSRFPIKARREDLDPRKLDFTRWRRATVDEITKFIAYKRECEERVAKLENERSRPEYMIASRLASTDTESWLKLGLDDRKIVESILELGNSREAFLRYSGKGK